MITNSACRVIYTPLIVIVRLFFNDNRFLSCHLSNIREIDWRKWFPKNYSVFGTLPRHYLTGYVTAANIDDFDTYVPSCPDHKLFNVLICKEDNLKNWVAIEAQFGSRPKSMTAHRYNPKTDARDLVQAIINNTAHPAWEQVGNKYVFRPNKVSRLTSDGTHHTHAQRAAKLRDEIEKNMKRHPEFKKTSYRTSLAYTKA